MMKLRINPIVAEDLKNIKEYIAEDNDEMPDGSEMERFGIFISKWRMEIQEHILEK